MELQRPTIAIVDDDLSFREALEGLVCSLGYVAICFASAGDFLEAEPSPQADCLIVDVQMPQMDGIAFKRRLDARGIRIPVIFVTSYPDNKVRARAMEAGAFAFLGKPFGHDALSAHLRAALAEAP